MANVLSDFWRIKMPKDTGNSIHYRSQSAKAHLRDKSKKENKSRGSKKKNLSIQDTSIDNEDKREDDFDGDKSESLLHSKDDMNDERPDDEGN